MSKYFVFIPNLLSIIRIYLMYPLLTFISEENYLFALYIFIFAAATDGLDGYLARVMDW
ncbi:CDP-alcohol phosphatidyltransferase family protein, partial [Gammaproteobacteria bacterium]|nr:CDP-alcohol phosphatidyltransferase family protein [Gammaproteobacteria bacterium]